MRQAFPHSFRGRFYGKVQQKQARQEYRTTYEEARQLEHGKTTPHAHRRGGGARSREQQGSEDRNTTERSSL